MAPPFEHTASFKVGCEIFHSLIFPESSERDAETASPHLFAYNEVIILVPQSLSKCKYESGDATWRRVR